METEQLLIIKTKDQLNSLIEYLVDKEYVAFDTETTGVVYNSEVIGLSICADTNIGYYVILSYWDKTKESLVYLETKEVINSLLTVLTKKQLVMHNAIFDCQMIKQNYNIDLMPSLHTDTMILGHLLNENRPNGLKELGISIFGDDAAKEQKEMKESIIANGGSMTKDCYELYKADADLIAKYGAKDALLTLKLFYEFVPQLYEESLDTFFYKEESMPLLKGPTYELNTTGLRVDPIKLENLKKTLEAECIEQKAFIYKEIDYYVKDKYPGTNKKNVFNIGASQQLAWLLFIKLNQEFDTLTKVGKDVCKALGLKLPYSFKAKREFIAACVENKGRFYDEKKKISDPWKYMEVGKGVLKKYASKYKWVDILLAYKKNTKLLQTYIEGIQERMQYNIIRPSFLQHGTTSGRYSSKNPNFQNLPRDEKRIKSCIISRPGKVFVGADYAQLEPRVFASFSNDVRLQQSFKSGDDFYSIIGMEVFEKYDCTPKKEGEMAFGVKYKKLRDIAKAVALSATYGTTAPKMALTTGKTREEAQDIIDSYFDKFPSVLKFMLESHEKAKEHGKVYNLFGRPRRMPQAIEIKKIFPFVSHEELPYEHRNVLNLAVNHQIQSTSASIVNRASIAFYNTIREKGIKDCHIVLQVHDELIIECKKEDALIVTEILKNVMENTVRLPGVELIAEPKIADNLGDLK